MTLVLTDRQWQNFWAKVEKTETCWLWTGSTTTKGYGSLTLFHRAFRAHQVSWRIANQKDIPVGMCVLHTCDVRRCVNPDHLWIGSNNDNMQDAITKNRFPRGEAKPSAKLTERQVRSIKRLLLVRGLTVREICRRFGVCPATIEDIRDGRKWRFVSCAL